MKGKLPAILPARENLSYARLCRMMRPQSPFSSRSRLAHDRIPAEVHASAVAPAPQGRRARRAHVVFASTFAVLGSLAISYTVGRVEAASKTQQVRAEAQKTAEQHERTVAALQTKLDVQSAEVTLLEARRRIHLSLMALGAGNFGIARDELERAGALLRDVPKMAETEAIPELSADLGGYQTVVTHDLGEQRTDLNSFATRLDEVIDTLRQQPGAKPAPSAI